MRLLLSASLVVLCLALGAQAMAFTADYTGFQQYTHQFNKVYSSPAEHSTGYLNFLKSHERILRLRKQHEAETGENADHIFGFNKFSDLSVEEFNGRFKGYKRSNATARPAVRAPIRSNVVLSNVAAPLASVDWRNQGAVTAVKNQEQCGGCWAFSAASEVESMYFMEYGKLVTLSEQQIISCDTNDNGCGGGDTVTAYEYIKSAGGLEADSSYPFTSGSGNAGQCEASSSYFVVGVTESYFAIPECTSGSCSGQDENDLASQLAQIGPLSICVNAQPWQDYTGGVMAASTCSGAASNLDHCVQLVGYKTGVSTPYWIVRNQWGTDWGYNGYIYLAMGSNTCGVADEATYVTTTSV